MFYEKKQDPALRFGDIVTGFILTTPEIKTPIIHIKDKLYNIDVNLSSFSVILTPCCSIGQNQVTLTPLLQLNIDRTLFRVPYFVEDMLRINFEVEPVKAIPPAKWERLEKEEQNEIIKAKNTFAYLSYFIYDGNEHLPEYSFKIGNDEITTNQYLIDFRRSYTIKCEDIVTSKNAPLHSKILQLTVPIRNQLREKISYYYGRIPAEDTCY